MELPNLITRVQRTSDMETTYGDVSKHQQNLLHSAHNIYRYRIKLVTPIPAPGVLSMSDIYNACTTFLENIPVFIHSHPKATMEAFL